MYSPGTKRIVQHEGGSAENIAGFLALQMQGRSASRFFKEKSGVLSEGSVLSAMEKVPTKAGKEDVRQALRMLVTQSELSDAKEARKALEALLV